MDKAEESVQGLIMWIGHRYFAKGFGQTAAVGIHPGQLPILKLLYDRDGISQTEISRKLSNRPSTVTVSLKRLEKMDLVRREADRKDQRIVRVYLTDRARDLFRRIPAMLEANEKLLLEGMSEAEVCLLKRLLKQVLENMQRLPDPKERPFCENMCKEEDTPV